MKMRPHWRSCVMIAVMLCAAMLIWEVRFAAVGQAEA